MRKSQGDYDVTFSEFLSYLVLTKNWLRHDEHFETYSQLCSPCAIGYDFIGKQETFDEDTQYLFTTIFRRNISTPNTPGATRSGKEATSQAFRQVPNKVKRMTMVRYSADSEMFGYNMHEFI